MPRPTIHEYSQHIGDPDLLGYLTGRYASDHSIRLTKEVMKACDGNAYDAVIMSQLLYWHSADADQKLRVGHKHDGEFWVVKSYAEWEEETGVNADSMRRIMTRLADRGLIIKSKHKSPYHNAKTVLYVRVNWPGFFEVMGIRTNPPVRADSAGSRGGVRADSADGVRADSADEVRADSADEVRADSANPVPKTTSDTTTETTSSFNLSDESESDTPSGTPTGRQAGSANTNPPPRRKRPRKRVQAGGAEPRQETERDGLAGFLAESAGANALTDNQKSTLNAMVTMRDPKDPGVWTEIGNPVEMWKSSPLFRVWVREQVSYFKRRSASGRVSRTHLVNGIRGSMAQDSKYGWKSWSAQDENKRKAPMSNKKPREEVLDARYLAAIEPELKPLTPEEEAKYAALLDKRLKK